MFSPFLLFPIDSRPYGLTYGEWSAKWWQWLLSIPMDRNPIFDTNGTNANVKQIHSKVFFLCQTFENSIRLPHRIVNFPLRKCAIFMPIINWISIQGHDGNTDQALLDLAREKMNVVTNLQVNVNGNPIEERLERYRVLSSFFNVDLPKNNILALSPGTRRAISDGFWLFIQPQHNHIELSTFGSCSAGLTKIGVNYDLRFVETENTVSPEK